jgi:hypothetical protein
VIGLLLINITAHSFAYFFYNGVQTFRVKSYTKLFSAQQPENLMTLDELKAELDLRQVDYSNCVTKQELVNSLIESRALGKAPVEIIDKFNAFGEEDIKPIDTDVAKDVVSKDGALPGNHLFLSNIEIL